MNLTTNLPATAGLGIFRNNTRDICPETEVGMTPIDELKFTRVKNLVVEPCVVDVSQSWGFSLAW